MATLHQLFIKTINFIYHRHHHHCHQIGLTRLLLGKWPHTSFRQYARECRGNASSEAAPPVPVSTAQGPCLSHTPAPRLQDSAPGLHPCHWQLVAQSRKKPQPGGSGNWERLLIGMGCLYSDENFLEFDGGEGSTTL